MAWLRLGLCLIAVSLLSACIGTDGIESSDSAPAWLQDDNAIIRHGNAPPDA